MKSLKNISTGLPHTRIALLFVLLAVGLLSGCQFEPAIINVLELPPSGIGFPQPTIALPPDTVGERQLKLKLKPKLKLAGIATRKFPIAKDRSIVGGLAAISAHDDDTLSDIARHFGQGYNDITIANPNISPWTLKAGTRVLLPLQFILPDTLRKGIVLNLANMRMYYYPPKQPDTVFTYPVGVGREGWNTPLGQTAIIAKNSSRHGPSRNPSGANTQQKAIRCPKRCPRVPTTRSASMRYC